MAKKKPDAEPQCPTCGGTGTRPDPVAYGAALRAKRTAAKMSLRELAEVIGCSHGQISGVELGLWSASLDFRKKIKEVLG